MHAPEDHAERHVSLALAGVVRQQEVLGLEEVGAGVVAGVELIDRLLLRDQPWYLQPMLPPIDPKGRRAGRQDVSDPIRARAISHHEDVAPFVGMGIERV